MARDPVVSDDFMLTFWEVLARGENCTDVRLARGVAGVQKTTYPSPAGVPMFSVVKFPQPTRIEVERARGYHALVQSRGRSLRAVAFAGGRWSSSVVTTLS